MKYAIFPPLGRELSRLVLGSMVCSLEALDLTFELLDAWRAAGGNVIDTAHIYAGGNSERAIGLWLEARACRDEMVILTKGAHHNADRRRVTPEDITCDLRDSLARLKTGMIDLYVLHRDDRDVPVGPIVEILNDHARAGRIRVFGGSNWDPDRLEEANTYAAAHGLQGFRLSSPHLSLAYPKEPVWAGCNHARDPETIAWYERTQMPLFSWSSQARGFFSGRFQPETLDNELIERVYAEPGNWERLRRAEELGRARGFSAIQVSLAWVLGQPFPVFPLIGPATVEELESCVEALDLELSAAERAWLDLQPLPTAERSLNG